MSTSKTYQQSLADAGSKNRPPILERGSYIPWANRKRDNRKWLLKALDEGPYEFTNFVPEGLTIPRLQTVDDLEVRLAKRLTVDSFDDLFDYLQQFKKLVNASRAKKLEKSHDPLALVAHTGSSSKQTSSYYVTHPTSVDDYDDKYQHEDVHNNSEDPLVFAVLLLAKAITQNFSNPTNNRLRASSNTRNQVIIQGDRVNIQSMNSGNTGRNNR
ncbi:hypothetical protein Tco_1149459 [Tanacetum coccineum]